jgi:Clp amino terminal domain, pathogenicity island component/NTF2 fold immunity protein
MRNEKCGEPLSEIQEIHDRMDMTVDKLTAMMVADLSPEEQRESRRWVRRMFERFTETARRVIFFARYEASQFGSTTIETEHFLLGLIREDNLIREDKNLSRFLRNHSFIESIRKEIEGRTIIREKVSTSIDLPLSNECKRILAYAAEEAERLNHRHIGTEHLLLGILREEKCVAAEILRERGFRLNVIREELARSPMPAERQTPPIVPEEMEAAPELHEAGAVPDADTAKRIAEALWIPKYGADTVARQQPILVELKFNVWIVTGSSSSEVPLFAFILQEDGRVLSVGGPTKP